MTREQTFNVTVVPRKTNKEVMIEKKNVPKENKR